MTGRPHSILVAESNRAIAQALRLHLSRAGFSVFVAHDGDQASILAARQRFDLIVADLDLPIISGKEFCRHLREDLRLIEVPVAVFASAGLKSEAEEMGFKHDIARVFSKPIDPSVVVQFANEAVKGLAASV